MREYFFQRVKWPGFNSTQSKTHQGQDNNINEIYTQKINHHKYEYNSILFTLRLFSYCWMDRNTGGRLGKLFNNSTSLGIESSPCRLRVECIANTPLALPKNLTLPWQQFIALLLDTMYFLRILHVHCPIKSHSCTVTPFVLRFLFIDINVPIV